MGSGRRTWLAPSAVICVLVVSPSAALGLHSQGHTLVTQRALRLLRSEAADSTRFDALKGTCSELPATSFREARSPASLADYSTWSAERKLVTEVPAVDEYRDLELVDVDGTGSDARDNPHARKFLAASDRPHYRILGFNTCAFNHFIDIRKGPGRFDDYDGYAYRKGSACKDEHETASAAVCDRLGIPTTNIGGYKLDGGINRWLADEYVHAPGQPWYAQCSPSVERYSFPKDKGVYATVEEECRARFPLANAEAATDAGIPYSVFMPVDNMARYWYGRFQATRDPAALGPVLHAVQDASVPHHAAGCNGNWHVRYEEELSSRILRWMGDASFAGEVRALLTRWDRTDPSPPTSLAPGDWQKTPAANWSVDQLVTWVALNAHREYRDTYGGFGYGYAINELSARTLAAQATAMSALVLRKACRDAS